MSSNSSDNSRFPQSVRVAAIMVSIAAAIYIITRTADAFIKPLLDVCSPFLIAFFIALLLNPLVEWLHKHKIRRTFGVAIVGIGFLTVFVAIGILLIPRIVFQANDMAANIQGILSDARQNISQLIANHKPLLVKLHLPTTASGWTDALSEQTGLAAKTTLSFVANALSAMGRKFMWIVIIPLATLWFLKDLDQIKTRTESIVPNRHKDRVFAFSSAVGTVFTKYVRGTLMVALLYSIVMTIIFTSLKLQHSLVIGAIAGLIYMVPYLGMAILVTVAGTAAIAMPPHSISFALLLAAIILSVNSIFDMVITPRIVGGSVGVHPVFALFSLYFGAVMFGVVGMLAAVPVAAVLQIGFSLLYPKLYGKLTIENIDTENPEPDS